MARCVCRFIVIWYSLGLTWASGDRIFFNEENERRWNTAPELTTGARNPENDHPNSPQPRFLPFSASFSLNAGSDHAHSLSVGGTNDGISLSQSQSSSSGNSYGGNAGTIAASQSSSFAAGLSGISAADANAFNLNHPIFGGNSKTNSHSFSLGQATSSAHSNVVNNKVTSGAQSSVGSANSGAGSSAGNQQTASTAEAVAFHGQGHQRREPSWSNIYPNYDIEDTYNPHRGPQLNQRPQNWSPNRDRDPSLQISAASASSGASSNSQNGFSFGQSSSQSNWGPNGPTSMTNNHVQSFGHAESHAQGTAAAVGQHSDGKTQASFGSGTISAGSMGNGHSQGSSVSGNRGQNSWGEISSQAVGVSNVQGTANAGSVSVVRFPDDGYVRGNIPREYVRSNQEPRRKPKERQRNPIDRFFTDITDTVVDIFDF